MRDEFARTFATNPRCLIVAPAGCGKTELIADAVRLGIAGKQLILTHTHAGVRALRARLRRKGVHHSKYTVDTISGFSLRYTSSFPSASGYRVGEPTAEKWPLVYEAARRALQRRHVSSVLTSTYTGLFVDEYQDCTVTQHQLVNLLADLLPTHIVGDPLQGIFDFHKGDELVDWPRDVYPNFERLEELRTPYRWLTANAKLGTWLIDARRRLLSGDSLVFNTACPLSWRPLPTSGAHQPAQILACRSMLGIAANETIAVIRKMPHQAHSLSKALDGLFRSMEEVECKDLMKWCDKLQESVGLDTARLTLDFALECMTSKPACLGELRRLLTEGELPGDRKLKAYADLKDTVRSVAAGDGPPAIGLMLRTISSVPEVKFHRRELFHAMQMVMRNHSKSSTNTLRDTAWRLRDRERHFDRPLDRRVVSRTLLMKGLEFDHAILPNVEEFDDAKSLYVALTRASKSLTILSESPTITRPAPEIAAPLVQVVQPRQLQLQL